LIRTEGDNKSSNATVTLTGRVLFIRLKSGTITATSVKYPNLVLEYRASGSGPGSNYIEVFVPNSGGGSISTPRTCSVVFSGVNIDFGNISALVQSQPASLSRGNSAVTVQCTGASSQTMLVTMSVSSASGQVTGDLSAIPMTTSGSANNDLVVKATLGTTSPDCQSSAVLSASDNNVESKWLNVINGTAYNILTFDPNTSGSNVTQSKTVNWYLCRRAGTNYLPIGQYTGSAVLSVTLN
jgi:hypothetical protein